jgi:hypothetical protein
MQTFQYIRDFTAIICLIGWVLLYFIDKEYTKNIRKTLLIIFAICILLLIYNIYLVKVN